MDCLIHNNMHTIRLHLLYCLRVLIGEFGAPAEVDPDTVEGQPESLAYLLEADRTSHWNLTATLR